MMRKLTFLLVMMDQERIQGEVNEKVSFGPGDVRSGWLLE